VGWLWPARAAPTRSDGADEYREAIAVRDALGHGNARMRVFVGGTPVMFDHGPKTAPADVAVRTA
jgi:hypothetical protein